MNTKTYAQLWREHNIATGAPLLRLGDAVSGPIAGKIVGIEGQTALVESQSGDNEPVDLLKVVPEQVRRGRIPLYPPRRPTTADF